MNEQKITKIWVILFIIVAVIILMIVSFIIKDAMLVALLHLISGSTCIALLVDELNDVIHNK